MAAPRTQAPSGSTTFDRLRDALAADAALRVQVENALLTLVEQINVSDRGNRWVVGGTAEWILAAASFAAGAIALPAGHNADGVDLEVVLSKAREAFSVKSSFSASASNFRITNGMGGGGRGLTDTTVFMHPRLPGIVLVDPTAHPDVASQVRTTKDAMVLDRTVVSAHAKASPHCVATLSVPLNRGRGQTDPTTLFAKQLLGSGHYPLLEKVFRDAAGTTRSIADEIRELKALRDVGTIDDEQLKKLVDAIAR